MRISNPVLLAALLVLPALLCLSAQAQSSVEASLLHKPLYLRGLWAADTLRFDPAGHLLTPSVTVPFTLAGVEITQVEPMGDHLALEGHRVGIELNGGDAALSRVPLQTSDGAEESIHIEIARNGPYVSALQAIFADSLASLVPAMPEYWQLYATRNFLAPGNSLPLHSEKEAKKLDKPIEKGGKDSILKPTLLRSAKPEYPEAARNLHYKAAVIVSLVVEKDGVPSHVQVLHPAGLGLDEQAIAAVRHYIFQPGTQKGRPVPTDLNIEVDFGPVSN